MELFVKKTTSEWLKRFLLIFTELVSLTFTALKRVYYYPEATKK
jgi:hypothetical protein